MRNFIFIFLLLPIISPAQKYAGKYYDAESNVGYNVLLLIRPDSSISLTFETINPPKKNGKSKRGDGEDPILYYDYHGLIHGRNDTSYQSYNDMHDFVNKKSDSVFYIDAKGVFSYRLDDVYYRHSYDKVKFTNDSMEMHFDSVQTFLKTKLYWSYGNVHDSLQEKKDAYYDSWLGFPRALNDSNHFVPQDWIYLPIDSAQFKKAKTMSLDIGYVNPVTNESVNFSIPYGYFPHFEEAPSGNFSFILENHKIYFGECKGILGLDMFLPPGSHGN